MQGSTPPEIGAAPPDMLPAEAVLSTAEPAAPPDSAEGVARATGVVALGNIASRILGMAREIVLTNLFGASRAVDAFYVATIIPKTIYDLLIAGHVNSAIVPVFSAIAARDGTPALWGVVSILASLVSVVLAVVTVGLVVFAGPIVSAVGSGYDANTLALAADLLRITAPALLCLSIFSIFSGALYALREFRYPALAGAVFNAAIVLTLLVFTPPPIVHGAIDLDTGAVLWFAERPPGAITSAAVGWLVGALAQLALQWAGMRGARLRFSMAWRNPAVRQIAKLYAPVMFSLILDTLVVRTVSYNLASQTGEGSLGYMNWATTLIQFPQGLVATAISIAILPTLSRQAGDTRGDAHALAGPHGDDTAFRDTLGLGLRLAITLILPAAFGLFVLGRPIVQLLFEHGAFTAADTAITTHALRLYLIGLPFAAVDLLLVYAFYARQDTLTPALIGFFSLLVYLAVAIALIAPFGLFSLMIADSVKHTVHAALSAVVLQRRHRVMRGQRLGLTAAKALCAAAVMAAAARLAAPPLEGAVRGALGLNVLSEAVVVVVCAVLSAGVFTAAAFVLRLEEWRWLGRMIRERLRR
jgi:putative peptidoglycan lipid II flippase